MTVTAALGAQLLSAHADTKPMPSGDELYKTDPSLVIDFDAEKLDQLIHENSSSILTPADLEKHLPPFFNWTRSYVYSSDSPQGGSFDVPRRIFYSAKIMIAVHPGSRFIEEIAYVSPDQGYKFYVYPVIGGKVGPRREMHPGEQVADVPSCFTCHTSGKPIFQSYPNWCGFYGSRDDLLPFKSNHKKSERYKYDKFAKNYDPYPFAFGQGAMNAKSSERPNMRLSGYVSRQNAQILAAKIKSSARYAELRDFIFYLLNCSAGYAEKSVPTDTNYRLIAQLAGIESPSKVRPEEVIEEARSRALKALGIGADEVNLGSAKERILGNHPIEAILNPQCAPLRPTDENYATLKLDRGPYRYWDGETSTLSIVGANLLASEKVKDPELWQESVIAGTTAYPENSWENSILDHLGKISSLPTKACEILNTRLSQRMPYLDSKAARRIQGSKSAEQAK